MKPTVEIKQSDLRYFKNMMQKAEKKTERFANNMVQNIAIVFFQKAAANTEPGKKQKVSKMAKKYRVRRVVKLTQTMQMKSGRFWYENVSTGKFFAAKAPISKKSRGDRLTPVLNAIEIWDKKRKRLRHQPTKKSRGLNGGNIPGHGAGKAAWSRGIRNLNNKTQDDGSGRLSPNIAKTRRLRGKNPLITHTNKVDYVIKTSPGCIAAGMSAAKSHFVKKEQRKFKLLARKEFQKSVNNQNI